MGAGRESEKIVVDDAETVFFEGGAEGGGLLDAVKLQAWEDVVVGVGTVVAGALVADVPAPGGFFDGAGEVAGTGGRLQDGAACVLDAVTIDLETGEQFSGEGRGRWVVVFAVVGDHGAVTSCFWLWRRAVVQLARGALLPLWAAVGLMPGGVLGVIH